MHKAVKNNNLKELRRLLNDDSDVNGFESEKRKTTPLHEAVFRFSNEVLSKTESQTQRKVAFCAGNPETDLEIVQILLQHKADASITNSEGKTPLHIALTSVSSISSKDTVFFREPNLNIVKLLIENGADVNARDNLNETPLHYILKQNSLNIQQLFGDDCIIEDSKKQAILKLLFDHGVDIDKVAKDGSTPLNLAVQTKDRVIIAMLLKKVDYNKNDNKVYCGQHYETKQIYLQHLVKLKSANLLTLNKEDYSHWKTRNEDFNWTTSEKKCELEIKKMQKTLICETRSISYWDILNQKLHVIALFLKLNEVKEKLNNLNLDEIFPEYADILRNRIHDAEDFASIHLDSICPEYTAILHNKVTEITDVSKIANKNKFLLKFIGSAMLISAASLCTYGWVGLVFPDY